MSQPPHPPQPTPPPPLAYSSPPWAYPPADAQAAKDADHLRLLALFHYIYGGLTMALGLVFIFHIIFGLMMATNPDSFFATPGGGPGGGSTPSAPPAEFEFVGYLMAGGGAFALLFHFTVGMLTIYAGRCMKWRRRRTLTLVVAGVNCIWVPLGTALGVFTFIVLMRDSVKALYASGAAPPAA